MFIVLRLYYSWVVDLNGQSLLSLQLRLYISIFLGKNVFQIVPLPPPSSSLFNKDLTCQFVINENISLCMLSLYILLVHILCILFVIIYRCFQ